MTAATEAVIRQEFATTTDYRQLITPELYNRLVSRIVKDEEVEPGLAGRIMDSALGFLYLSATSPGQRLSPSPLVDIGWHTFILYTRGYREFCQRVAGRFIDHEPNDVPEAPQKPSGIKRTIAAFKAAGLPIDEMLWTGWITRKKTIAVLTGGALDPCASGSECAGGPECGSCSSPEDNVVKASADPCTVDCDNGSGGPGDECTCS
ncbi:glycine-rich domain-containing protein [Streptomyces pseudovenezuelae]|uniref:glycine-rich domain-containing protein n=1 Tax=Streptomyces pseudovenezuelae TaxID=67350 RepID=UPI0036E024E0